MAETPVLWYDIVNPSDVWFFKPLLARLEEFRSIITIRDRAETKALAKSSGIKGNVIGAHYTDRIKKNIGMPARFAKLFLAVRGFDVGLFFENGLALTACKLKGRPSILFCDNDLKWLEIGSFLQNIENRFKATAEHLVIPAACYNTFRRFAPAERIITYEGYKEDIYIADYVPDEGFRRKLDLEDYAVVRPEALDSSYVGNARTLVPKLLELLSKENIPIVFLPREKGDEILAKGFDVLIPATPLNGLDLCYHSRAVLTGSGTMAREAACLGRPAVSFFPGNQLLSVDRQLVKEGRMIHTRDPDEIVKFVASSSCRRGLHDLSRSKSIQASMVKDVRTVLERM